jgi:hypothetical protein
MNEADGLLMLGALFFVIACCAIGVLWTAFDQWAREINGNASNHCPCPACNVTPHKSDCAIHNAPALPPGPCDCK